MSPDEIQRKAQTDLSQYSAIDVVNRRAACLTVEISAFEIETSSGQKVRTSRFILAQSMIDRAPDTLGLAEGWWQDVLPYPYCHRYEVADQPTGAILNVPGSLHLAWLLRDWTNDLAVSSNEVALYAVDKADLENRGVSIIDAHVFGVKPSSRAGLEVYVQDPEQVVLSIVYVVAKAALSTSFAGDLRSDIAGGSSGPIISVNEHQLITMPGVDAAGDITRPVFGSTWAAADCMSAGIAFHQPLVLSCG